MSCGGTHGRRFAATVGGRGSLKSMFRSGLRDTTKNIVEVAIAIISQDADGCGAEGLDSRGRIDRMRPREGGVVSKILLTLKRHVKMTWEMLMRKTKPIESAVTMLRSSRKHACRTAAE